MKNRFKKVTSAICAFALATTMLMSATVSTSALSYSGSSSYKSGKYYTALTNVKLTGNQRKDIVNVAMSQIGYHEGSNSSSLSGVGNGSKNYTEFGRWYGTQDMWCAMFVSWCANTAGVSQSVVPKHSFTVDGLNWFQKNGLAYSRQQVANGKYTPKPGDIIYFKSSRNSNKTNHVGIVKNYSNKTVYTIEGNKSDAVKSCSYSISNNYIVYICSPKYKEKDTVTLNKTSLSLTVGNYATLKATKTGGKISSWTSSNKSVATVTSDGKVKAVAPGTANITVKLNNGNKATCKVTVKKATVALDKTSLSLVVGNSATLKATKTGDKISSWTSSNKSVAKVTSDGKVKAVAPGTANITVKLNNGNKATCKVTVKKATVKLDKTSLSLAVGSSATLKATKTGSKISSWTSSNKSVATVTSDGKVKAVAPGTANITVKLANGEKATCKVTVKKVVYYKKCSASQKSIVDALKSIGVDSSMNNRKKIAVANNISNYTGTAAQNEKMLNLLKQGKLIKP